MQQASLLLGSGRLPNSTEGMHWLLFKNDNVMKKINSAHKQLWDYEHGRTVPSVSISTARFWKMSMWDECAMVAMPGVWPLLCMYCIACVPTYSTRAFISGMLYFIPGVLDTCQYQQQTHLHINYTALNWTHHKPWTTQRHMPDTVLNGATTSDCWYPLLH